jgi:hypothetical protein
MHTNKTGKSFIFSSLLLLTLLLTGCGGKKQSDVVTAPAEQANAVNCALWTENQKLMSASYGIAESKGSKIFINKLSIMQLMGSLKLDSDAALDKVKTELLDKFDHAPANDDPLYTIEFTQDAITLRDRISLGIQTYVEKCQ